MTLTPEDATPDHPAPPDTWPNASTNPSTGTSYTEGWIESRRFGFIELVLEQIVIALTNVFPGVGGAFDALKNWVDVLLPDQIMQPINALWDAIIGVLGDIPIIGGVIENIAGAFGYVGDKADTAQDTANTANSAIAELRAQLDAGTTGELIIDTFDRPLADNLGPNWTQTYSGSGKLGTDGNGLAHWDEAGTSSGACNALYTAQTLNTDYQVARFVLDEDIADYFIDHEMWLVLRSNLAFDTYVRALVHHNSCEIGYVVGGSYTRMGADVSITTEAGDVWEFRAGTATTGDGPYTFQLLQNGVTKCERVDTGHVSQLGASHIYAGMIIEAGVQVVFGASVQKSPPDIQVFTATDRTVA